MLVHCYFLVFRHFEGNFAMCNTSDCSAHVSQAFSLKLCCEQAVPVQVNKDHSTKPEWLGDHNSAKVYLHWILCLSLYISFSLSKNL